LGACTQHDCGHEKSGSPTSEGGSLAFAPGTWSPHTTPFFKVKGLEADLRHPQNALDFGQNGAPLAQFGVDF